MRKQPRDQAKIMAGFVTMMKQIINDDMDDVSTIVAVLEKEDGYVTRMFGTIKGLMQTAAMLVANVAIQTGSDLEELLEKFSTHVQHEYDVAKEADEEDDEEDDEDE